MHNTIPRVFHRIVAKAVSVSSFTQPGDILHVFKNDFGYLCLNVMTGKYAYAASSQLRDKTFVEFINVE